jgi:ReqiPepy6 Gp37-like protein
VELYTLDGSLKRDAIIEGYISAIWTERYNTWGDFEIVYAWSAEIKNRFQPGLLLGLRESYRVMILETVVEDTGDDGTRTITFTGRDLLAWLDDRVAYPALDDLTTNPQWTPDSGTPGAIARFIFQQIIESHILDAHDTLPYYHTAPGPLPAGDIPEPTDVLTLSFNLDTLYNTLSGICTTYNLGMRLYKDGDTGNIYFDIYTGFDRTSAQTVREAVIFSSGSESLGKTSVLTSIAGFKNVAYVFSQHGNVTRFAKGYSSSTPNSQRKVMFVDASDLDDPSGFALTGKLNQRGDKALADNRRTYTLDGEITQYQPYTYGVHYNLGDLVEERSEGGFINEMIVTEQIFVSDDQGDRSYPTLTVSTFATAGSWDALPDAEFWDDVDPATVWDDE